MQYLTHLHSETLPGVDMVPGQMHMISHQNTGGSDAGGPSSLLIQGDSCPVEALTSSLPLHPDPSGV